MKCLLMICHVEHRPLLTDHDLLSARNSPLFEHLNHMAAVCELFAHFATFCCRLALPFIFLDELALSSGVFIRPC